MQILQYRRYDLKRRNRMKETYTQPEMEIIHINAEDIIVTSGEGKYFDNETEIDP